MAMVPKNLYGYGTSILSIKNKKNAMDEEMIGDKDVGLLGVYHVNEGSDGYIASALYTSRIKKHLNEFLDTCIKDNTIGDVYKINTNDELVKVIPYSMNLFDNTIKIENNSKFKSFRFSLDFDYFNKLNNTVFKANDIRIRIGFTVTKDNENKNYYIEETLEKINNKAFKFDYTVFENQDESNEYSFIVNTMEILLPSGYNNKINTLVIYDILLALVS